jgi:hypothetical protein
VDTTAPLRAARFGAYWAGSEWKKTTIESDFFYRCLARSYENLRATINPDRRVWSPRARNRQHDYEEWFAENHPDADLWGPDEVHPSPRYPTDGPVPGFLRY